MSQPHEGSSPTLEADLLVVGGGMAGMSAAAAAAEQGATVIVVEKGKQVGGSAVLSGGGVWTAADYTTLRSLNPDGDPALGRTLTEDFPDSVAWVRSLGVDVSGPVSLSDIMGFDSVCYPIDILSYVQRCRAIVEQNGGWVVTGGDVVSLLVGPQGRVGGAIVHDREGEGRVTAPWTLLATGGFQNDAELRKRFIGPHAADILVRSNPNSAGTGLRLAEQAGGAVSPPIPQFYGHTMAAPLTHELRPSDYIRLAQFYSPRGILLDRRGQRFTDESLAYYHNAMAVSRLPEKRALLVGDQQVLEADQNAFGEKIDRPREAAAAGAHVAVASTAAALARQASAWGYPNVDRALTTFNEQMAGDRSQPPRTRHRRPLDTSPYFAVEVQPAITFPFRGIRVNALAQVLDPGGEPVGGLLCAGADAGGLYVNTYAGGLAMGLVFGRRAARTSLEN